MKEHLMITVTPAAAAKIGDLFREQDTEGASLRVFVRSNGTEQPQVGMAIEPEPTDRDEMVETEGIKVVVDAESLPFVIGSEIDYLDSMVQAGFTIRNPNLAGGGCACGGGGACGCGGGAQAEAGAGACACGGGGACACGAGAQAEAGACACGADHGHAH